MQMDGGYRQFLKMMEIDKHLRSEVEWWRGEGMPLSLLAVILRSVARGIDPDGEPKPSWGEQWRSSAGYQRAMDHIAQRRAKLDG